MKKIKGYVIQRKADGKYFTAFSDGSMDFSDTINIVWDKERAEQFMEVFSYFSKNCKLVYVELEDGGKK